MVFLSSERNATNQGSLDFRLHMHRRYANTVAVLLLLGFCRRALSRMPAPLEAYCPDDPSYGRLNLKSVDSDITTCTPSPHDYVGQAVYECWWQFNIAVNSCLVSMRPDASRHAGAGRLPCRPFGLSGNLTTDGLEGRVWADVDGPALLSYFEEHPEVVASLGYDNARAVVRHIWTILREFTSDLRFDDDSWIDDNDLNALQEEDHRVRRLATAAVVGTATTTLQRDRHGPMHVYRPSAGRMMLKMSNGCKYRYTINPDSHVFEPPARHRAHVAWRTLVAVVACLAVSLSAVGLGVCIHMSRRHAQFVAQYWEYQAVQDHSGSDMQPSTFLRVRLEPPPKPPAAPGAQAGTPQA
ncbi:hypothetical protein Agub_g14271 [Astrephomene gubernaculifera]|uniref:Uncharacterized protein n=1 Tax=Astrephomene gubernaculifera TaxID=47775 RepID=A0AAD3E2T8_9CHLO|nr:hypothetical protein Agub_g14271 [Astrephomene gubernaculifera]